MKRNIKKLCATISIILVAISLNSVAFADAISPVETSRMLASLFGIVSLILFFGVSLIVGLVALIEHKIQKKDAENLSKIKTEIKKTLAIGFIVSGVIFLFFYGLSFIYLWL